MALRNQLKPRNFLRDIYDALGFDAVEKRYRFTESVKRVWRYYYRLVWQQQANYHRRGGALRWDSDKTLKGRRHAVDVDKSGPTDVFLRWLEQFTLTHQPTVYFEYHYVLTSKPLPLLSHLPHVETPWYKLQMLQLQQLVDSGWQVDNLQTHQNVFQRCLDTLKIWKSTGQIAPELYQNYETCIRSQQEKYHNYYTSKALHRELWRGLDSVSVADKWAQYLQQRAPVPQSTPGQMSRALQDEIQVGAQLRAFKHMAANQTAELTAPGTISPVSSAELQRPGMLSLVKVSGAPQDHLSQAKHTPGSGMRFNSFFQPPSRCVAPKLTSRAHAQTDYGARH